VSHTVDPRPSWTEPCTARYQTFKAQTHAALTPAPTRSLATDPG